MAIFREKVEVVNYNDADGTTDRQSRVEFYGFSSGEIDGNDALSGLGATTQSTGSGLNDITFGGLFTGATSVTYYVKIDATGTPDTFSWSKDNFSTTEATGVSLTGSAQTLDNGITITASATTGHTLNDVWQMTTLTGATPHKLAEFVVDHEGTSADDKGEMFIKINNGSGTINHIHLHANGETTFSGQITNSVNNVKGFLKVVDANGTIINTT